MVSKTSELFPEPETPVTTVSLLCGMASDTFLRLWTRAPRMMMESCKVGYPSIIRVKENTNAGFRSRVDGMVPASPSRLALAPNLRSLRDLVVGGDAAADASGDRHSVL